MFSRRALPPAAFPAAAFLALAACSDSTGPEVTDPRLFVAIDAGGAHTCGVTYGQKVACWGYNRSGQVGDGSKENRFLPTTVSSGASFETVSAGEDHTCALTEPGMAFCWGSNGSGQLGIVPQGPQDQSREIPVAVTTDVRFSAVSAGYGHTCGLDLQGKAYCWGHNGYGQLGIGSDEEKRNEPGAVDTDLRFEAISAGREHTCAVDGDGRIHCWGDNRHGELGVPVETTFTTSPTMVAGGRSWKTVSAGAWHTCGVTTDGGAFCWGLNSGGQLGASTGEASHSATPLPVSGSHEFETLTAGSGLSCAVTLQGETYCWGSGPLGDGVEESSSVPVAVSASVAFQQVNASSHSCALDRGGVAYCWGSNEHGQLGVGSAHSLAWLVPVPVKMW
jgi:alpha-tubulin suppressor-like RCC1 family protein